MQVGGPRYVPRSVNQAAFRVLDALFPMGKLSRRAVSLLFRLWLHPGAPGTCPGQLLHTAGLGRLSHLCPFTSSPLACWQARLLSMIRPLSLDCCAGKPNRRPELRYE